MSDFKGISREEQQKINGGKTIVLLSPSIGGYQLAIKYLASFVSDIRRGIGAGVDDARRDYENGLIY